MKELEELVEAQETYINILEQKSKQQETLIKNLEKQIFFLEGLLELTGGYKKQ